MINLGNDWNICVISFEIKESPVCEHVSDSCSWCQPAVRLLSYWSHSNSSCFGTWFCWAALSAAYFNVTIHNFVSLIFHWDVDEMRQYESEKKTCFSHWFGRNCYFHHICWCVRFFFFFFPLLLILKLQKKWGVSCKVHCSRMFLSFRLF